MQKLKVWILVILNWLVVFGTPLITGYLFLLAEKPTVMTGFLYAVVAVVGIVFTKKISTAIKKMEASFTKAIFKLVLALGILYIVWVFVSYIGVNFNEVAKVILFSIAGRIAGFILEMIAIKIDETYVEKIGVI